MHERATRAAGRRPRGAARGADARRTSRSPRCRPTPAARGARSPTSPRSPTPTPASPCTTRTTCRAGWCSAARASRRRSSRRCTRSPATGRASSTPGYAYAHRGAVRRRRRQQRFVRRQLPVHRVGGLRRSDRARHAERNRGLLSGGFVQVVQFGVGRQGRGPTAHSACALRKAVAIPLRVAYCSGTKRGLSIEASQHRYCADRSATSRHPSHRSDDLCDACRGLSASGPGVDRLTAGRQRHRPPAMQALLARRAAFALRLLVSIPRQVGQRKTAIFRLLASSLDCKSSQRQFCNHRR